MRQHMFHMYSTKQKTQYRHPLTSTSTQICHLCKKPWTPITIPIKNKYINLHHLLQSKGYITGLEQNNPFLTATVDRTSNGPLRTNFSITSPPNTKSQKQTFVRKIVFKTPTHSPTKYEETSYDTNNDSYNTTDDERSKYV